MKTFTSGYIHAEPTIKDWIVGGETGVVYEPINPTGDWTSYQSPYERQKTASFDTNFCVVYASLRSVSTLCNYLKSQGKFSQDTLTWLETEGYIVNGFFEFNESFTAYMAGNQRNGNNLFAVWEAIRKKGLIPQKDWKQIEDVKKWEELMVEPTKELKDKALKFLEVVQINWEWLLTGEPDPDKITVALQASPIQIVNPVCGSWTTEKVKVCGSETLQHSELIIKSDDSFTIADTYDPFVKKFPKNYYIPYAIKPTVTIKQVKPQDQINHKFTAYMKVGDSNKEVYILQQVLKSLGLLSVNPTGNYLERTREAVKQFQINNGIPHNNGVQAGPQTIKALNALTWQGGVNLWERIINFLKP